VNNFPIFLTFKNGIILNNKIYIHEWDSLDENVPSVSLMKNNGRLNCIKSFNFSNLKTILIQNDWLYHNIDGGNIGHYFNDHFYALICSALKLNLNKVVVQKYLNQDKISYFDSTTNGAWAHSLYECMNFESLNLEKDIIYRFDTLYFPSSNRSLSFNLPTIDPLHYIRDQVLKKLNVVPKKNSLNNIVFHNKQNDRQIINSNEVILELVKKYSVRVIEDHKKLTFRENIEILNQNSYYIAPWGSHITNAFLSYCNIIDLRPSLFLTKNLIGGWWDNMKKIANERMNITYNTLFCQYESPEDNIRESFKTLININDIQTYFE